MYAWAPNGMARVTINLRPNILVADDSSSIRRIVRNFLQKIAPDSTILEAEDGHAALKLVVETKIDIVFLDINMPGMSGLDALHLLSKTNEEIFVVLMSGDADETVIEAGNELGSYDFLKKPFNIKHVRAILKNYANLSQRKKVLVVDDSSTVRRIIRRVLANCRFDMLISEVDSGQEALALLPGTQPDIIFLDYLMPGLNGLEAASYIRAHNPAVKLVMVTSADMSREYETCRNAGVFALINKPFFPNEVDFVLHRLYGMNMPHSLRHTPNVTLLCP